MQAPLLAAARPDLFGMTEYAELIRADSEETLQKFDASWADFANSPAAAAVSLTLPRVLARMPYGAETEPVEAFAFEEISGPDPNQYVWMSARLGLRRPGDGRRRSWRGVGRPGGGFAAAHFHRGRRRAGQPINRSAGAGLVGVRIRAVAGSCRWCNRGRRITRRSSVGRGVPRELVLRRPGG